MLSKAERLLAFRFLRPQKGEGFLSVIAGFSLVGIALGVATLIIVMSVMNGFREELMSQVLGLNGHLGLYGSGKGIENYTDIVEKVRRQPHVLSATPQLERQAMLFTGNEAKGLLVRGVTAEAIEKRTLLYNGLYQKNLKQFAGGSIIIGNELARALGVGIGDQIRLIAPQITTTIAGSVPRMKTFTIVDVFSVGMYEYDSFYVYIPLDFARIFFQSPENQVDAIEIVADNSDAVPVMRQNLFGLRLDDVVVRDWQDSNRSFFDAIQVERNVMFLILTLIILVAAFNIIATVMMLVKNKTSDIAILRTMGCTRGGIQRIFMTCGLTIGVLGTLGGFVLGVLFTHNIESIRQGLESLSGTRLFPNDVYFLSKLPAKIDWDEVVTVVGMALAITFVAAWFPARKAAKLDPVAALRYE